MEQTSQYSELGCGFFGKIFQWPRKVPLYSLPSSSTDTTTTILNSKLKKLSSHSVPDKNSRASISYTKSQPRRKSTTELNQIVSVDKTQTNKEARALIKSTSSSFMVSAAQLGNVSSKSSNATIKANVQNGVMGNIVRRKSSSKNSNLGPEMLKSLGNEKYKKGRFREALDSYNKAISIDSTNAVYRSNRSAALIGLGHLFEAAIECQQAILLDPSYNRPHRRLATLYLRFGEAESSMHHFKQAGSDSDAKDIVRVKLLQEQLTSCEQARKLKQWTVLLKETELAVVSGVDSCPKIYALKAEALLRLHRHEEAYSIYEKGPAFPTDYCTKLFGPVVTSFLLTIKAQVYIAVGRFEDAILEAQKAEKLDASNTDIIVVLKNARTIASARLSGNLLFKASQFSEACVVYNHGLDYDKNNSVLLCNRAACRSKLGQFEKAVEDCSAALNLRPCYSKARLRRADCYAKLEKWKAAIEDYEMLIRENREDEELGWVLFQAQAQYNKGNNRVVAIPAFIP